MKPEGNRSQREVWKNKASEQTGRAGTGRHGKPWENKTRSSRTPACYHTKGKPGCPKEPATIFNALRM